MLRSTLPIMAMSAILLASALAQGLATVSGTVVDYPGSTPLAGVHVRLIGIGETQEVAAYGAVTDHDGRFSISQILPGSYRASPVESTGYFFVPVLKGDKRASDLTVKARDRVEGLLLPVARAGVIVGRVIGDDGELIEGVIVSAVLAEQPALPILAHAGGGWTDDHGMYRLSCSPGKYRVSVAISSYQGEGNFRADGRNFVYASTDSDAVIEVQPKSETRIADIRLKHAAARTPKHDLQDDARVEGTVVDNATGKPLSYASVTLHPAVTEGEFKVLGPAERLMVQRMHTYYGATKADGSFVMEGLAAGRYEAYAVRAGYVRGDIFDATGCTLKAGEKTTLVLKLSRAAAISGRVLDENGNPCALVNVYASRDDEGHPEQRLSAGYFRLGGTDESGEFRIYGLAGGRFRVYAARDYKDQHGIPPEAPDAKSDVVYGPTFYPSTSNKAASNWVEVPAGGEVTGIDIRLVRTPTFHVSGRVTSARGAPPPARIEILTLDSGYVGEVRPAPDGAFTFWRLSPGRYQLIAYTDEPAWKARSEIEKVEIDGDSVEGVELSIVSASNPVGGANR